MSLKGFHILFLVFAVLTALGFYGWTLAMAEDAAVMGVETLGKISAAIGAVLLVYTTWFIVRKSKTIIVS